jgi:hypothetical protein
MSVSVAHAHPKFTLAESQATAGDTVHFTITGAKGRVSYELEIGDREVAEDSASSGKALSGQFTMPDLGGSDREVTVEAQIEESHKTTTARRKIRYLAAVPAIATPVPAIAVPVMPAPAPPAAPAPAPPSAAPQAAPGPEPTHVGQTSEQARSRGAATKRVARGPRPHVRGRRTAARRRSAGVRDGARRRSAPARKARGRRAAARTAPLFDGVPESPGAGGAERAPRGGNRLPGLNAIAPPSAALTAAPGAAGGGPAAAVLVPALLGLVALLVAGTALARKRRLAAGAGASSRAARR